MKYIINTTATLKVGGRKAPIISDADFINKIKAFDYSDWCGGCDVFKFIAVLGSSSKGSKFYKDISKIDFDLENVDKADDFNSSWSLDYLDNDLPLLRTKSGIPYLCCAGCGDWEVPVIFMIYWDGKDFRGYVPSKGNSFNYITKEAFGTSEPADDRKLFDKEGIPYTIDQDGDPVLNGEYCYESIEANIDMCIEDFEARVVPF